eukprot:SAG31_NODE_6543_length_1982_cov_1.248540_1_plen_34_part_10
MISLEYSSLIYYVPKLGFLSMCVLGCGTEKTKVI